MKILLLGGAGSLLRAFVESHGDHTILWSDPIAVLNIEDWKPDFIVSYGYRYILHTAVLERLSGNAVNLHISLLPFNRGADPNLWSFLEGTPKGVSIHHVDRGVDTGDLILQREVQFGEFETLRTTYTRLHVEIEALFKEVWPAIREGRARRRAQPPGGTAHRSRDRMQHTSALRLGYDTPVREIEDYGRRAGLGLWRKNRSY